MILELNRAREADDEGRYRFGNVPAGTYHLEAHVSSALTHESERVTVVSGETATLDFILSIAVMEHEITVTASGRVQTVAEAIQSVETRNSFELAEDIAPSIGETLANRPGNGIAKRSFGPGTERPMIRGFDGDRVMIMQDGIRSGALSLLNPATMASSSTPATWTGWRL